MKTHSRKKSSRIRGRKTIGYGARKKHKLSGHKGGIGMAGSGKRNDQIKTLITKLYGGTYFGKQGVTSRGTQKDKSDRINLRDIELNLDSLVKKGIAKKSSSGFEISLPSYVILGTGEVNNKLNITCLRASKVAIEKIQSSGGKVVFSSIKDSNTKSSSEESNKTNK